ncbi:MAG: CHAP domain-containing protein [Stellaceae bacterium]
MIFLSLHARSATAGNCALYARAQTGVDLYGAAGGWWDEAAAHYWRGRVPQVGAILVFKRTGAIPSGHVAVVARVVGPREIVVDQANWYHGMVTPDVPVIDESPGNDWTTVAVMDLGSGNYGRDYPSYGFVYPQTGPREIVGDTGSDSSGRLVAATPAAYVPDPSFGARRGAIVADSDRRRRNARRRSAARASSRRKAPTHAPHLASSAHARGRAAGHGHSFAHVHPAVRAHGFGVHAEPAHSHAQTSATRRAEAEPHFRG